MTGNKSVPCRDRIIATHYTRTEMTILITSDRLIKEIQEEFNNFFPFMKIEFFKKGYGYKRFFQNTQILPDQYTMRRFSRIKMDGKFEITPFMTGKELKEQCEEQFGVLVQLYRKSGSFWMEITITDNWTLKQQNDHGDEISSNNL